MIGYEKLLELRRKRAKPSVVILTDGADRYAKDWHTEVAARSRQFHAHIQVDQGENPDALDLRALIGLLVMVTGLRGEERTRRLFATVVAAKPLAAVACLPNETLFFDSRSHGEHSDS